MLGNSGNDVNWLLEQCKYSNVLGNLDKDVNWLLVWIIMFEYRMLQI